MIAPLVLAAAFAAAEPSKVPLRACASALSVSSDQSRRAAGALGAYWSCRALYDSPGDPCAALDGDAASLAPAFTSDEEGTWGNRCEHYLHFAHFYFEVSSGPVTAGFPACSHFLMSCPPDPAERPILPTSEALQGACGLIHETLAARGSDFCGPRVLPFVNPDYGEQAWNRACRSAAVWSSGSASDCREAGPLQESCERQAAFVAAARVRDPALCRQGGVDEGLCRGLVGGSADACAPLLDRAQAACAQADASPPPGLTTAEAARLVGALLTYTQDLATGDGRAAADIFDVEMAQSVVLDVSVEPAADEGVYRIHHLLSRSWTVPVESELAEEPAVKQALDAALGGSPGAPGLKGEARDRFIEIAAAVAAGVDAATDAGFDRRKAWDQALADWSYFGFKSEGVEWGPTIGSRARAQSLKFLRHELAIAPEGPAPSPAAVAAAREAWTRAQALAGPTQFLLGFPEVERALNGRPEGVAAARLPKPVWSALIALTAEERPAYRGRAGALWEALDPEAAVELARLLAGERSRPLPPAAAAAPAAFEDVTSSVPAIPQGPDAVSRVSVGAAILDYDGDGRPDLYVRAGPAGGRLLRNLGGFRFEDVTEQAGLVPGAPRVAAADYDNDGRPDLFLMGAGSLGRNRLLHNEGHGRFKDVTEQAGLSAAQGLATAAVWFDYDHDGRLDLYVVQSGQYIQGVTPSGRLLRNAIGNKLYHNNGDGTFTEVASTAGVVDGGWGWAAIAFDYDDDGWPDLFVCNNFGGSRLYRNKGDGTFEDVTARVGLDVPSPCKGAAAGDFDHSGRMSLFVSASSVPQPPLPEPLLDAERFTGVEGDTVTAGGDVLYRNVGGRFEAVRDALSQGAGWSWNGFFFDYDLDGWQDLYVINGFYPDLLFFHDENKALYHFDPAARRFVAVPGGAGAGVAGVSRGSAFADFDGDGCPDLVVTGLHGTRLLRNLCREHGHWLKLSLRGTRSNRDGIGARVVVAAGDLKQAFDYGSEGGGSVSSFWGQLLVGLGRHAKADTIMVRWPSGRVQTLRDEPADRLVEVVEP